MEAPKNYLGASRIVMDLVYRLMMVSGNSGLVMDMVYRLVRFNGTRDWYLTSSTGP
jgi:hypothetical protein